MKLKPRTSSCIRASCWRWKLVKVVAPSCYEVVDHECASDDWWGDYHKEMVIGWWSDRYPCALSKRDNSSDAEDDREVVEKHLHSNKVNRQLFGEGNPKKKEGDKILYSHRPLAWLRSLAWVGTSWSVMHRGGKLDKIGEKKLLVHLNLLWRRVAWGGEGLKAGLEGLWQAHFLNPIWDSFDYWP